MSPVKRSHQQNYGVLLMKLFFVMLLLVVFITFVNAQQPIVLTLDKAVELALENNLSIIQTQNNVDAAHSRVLAAYGNYLPTLSASGSWDRTQSTNAGGIRRLQGVPIPVPASTSTNNSFQAGVSLGYTIFDGFRREASFNSTTASATSTEQTAVRTRQSIRYQIESAYLNVLRQEQLVKVSEENLKRDQRQLERITESNRVGALSLADVYRQQSQVAADELSVINAQNDYDKGKADMVALIGLDMNVEYQFVDATISTTIDPAELNSTIEKYKIFNELVQRAIAARPDFLAAKESYNASESGITAARSGYFPRVSASAGYGFSNSELSKLSDNKNLSWGLNLSWNIFDAFQTNEALQSAIVTKKNSETTLRQSEREINVEVKKAMLDLEAARKQVEVSQKGLQSATEDRKIAEERYNLGAGTLLDLLTANAGLVNAEANNINSSFSFNIAKRNLEYVIGERTN
jgi:outer membrane protein